MVNGLLKIKKKKFLWSIDGRWSPLHGKIDRDRSAS